MCPHFTGGVGPRRGGDLAGRIVGEVQRQAVRGARKVVGQLLEPAHRVIAVVGTVWFMFYFSIRHTIRRRACLQALLNSIDESH